jgi:hypothetical protein
MRKYIHWFYVLLITLIIGAVFFIGCGSAGTESGPVNSNTGKRTCSWDKIWSKSQCEDYMNNNRCSGGGTWYSGTGWCYGYECDYCNF